MLLREIEMFLRASGMSATAFGRAATRDPALVHDLRRGREPGASITARVRAFIAAAVPGSASATTGATPSARSRRR